MSESRCSSIAGTQLTRFTGVQCIGSYVSSGYLCRSALVDILCSYLLGGIGGLLLLLLLLLLLSLLGLRRQTGLDLGSPLPFLLFDICWHVIVP